MEDSLGRNLFDWMAIGNDLEEFKVMLKVFIDLEFQIDFSHQDKNGKSLVHHIVQPLEFGSFENYEFLRFALWHFKLDLKDSNGHTPIYYASK